MTLRQYLTVMIISSIMCWTAFGFVITNIDPFETKTLGFVFFYTSLYLALLGTASVILFLLYKLFSRIALPMFRYVKQSFRDAAILAGLAILSLYLLGKDLLNFMNSVLLLAMLVSFTIFFLFLKKSRPTI